LYNSNPTEESFRHYAPNAQFEDPLQFSANLPSVKSAFKSLPMIFKNSEVTKSEADIDTNPMRLNLETRYEWKAFNKETVIRSIVLLTLNDQEQILRHEERWNGEPIPNAESGFFGRIKEVNSNKEINSLCFLYYFRHYVMLQEVLFTQLLIVKNRLKKNRFFCHFFIVIKHCFYCNQALFLLY
jgi:hypothetical protein